MIQSQSQSDRITAVHRGLPNVAIQKMDLCNRSGDRSSKVDSSQTSSKIVAVGNLGWAVAGDMTSLTTLVAGLSSSVEWSAVWSRAITRDVTKLSASIALHSLSLAIPGKVVWSTALVASSWAGSTLESTTGSKTTLESTARGETTTSSTWDWPTCASWGWA